LTVIARESIIAVAMAPSRRLRVCGLLVLGLLAGRTASAAGVDAVVRQGGLGASAFFRSEGGCISTAVFMVANADTERLLPASGTRGAQVALVISQFDVCHVVPLPILTGNGVSEDAMIVVSPNLRDATVKALVPVLNLFNGQMVDVVVDLTFVGTSIMVADNGVELNPYVPGFFITTTFNQTFRDAIAIGSVTTLDGDELTPEPSDEAMIQNVRAGTVTVARP
jgi:hypothetical protein